MTTTVNEGTVSEFLVDSGCTNHMTNNKDCMVNVVKSPSQISTNLKVSKMKSCLEGTIETEAVILNDVPN